ncbi:MAG TPA: PQQ-dependent sugar dehydrogenase [Longimicrobiales bacterium]|nr:PQQ-dependent sugar dehydrogenase [Longimicrobiales bacterium]
MTRIRGPLVLAVLFAACDDGGVVAPPPSGNETELELVAEGFDSPVFLTAPPGDDRLFIVEQTGTIRIIEDGAVLAEPFLDIRGRVRSGGEQGLLGLAFHPAYGANGWFYVNYTDTNGDTRIERYQVSGDPDIANPASAELVLAIEQPFANHNGGMIAFGPDGALYVATGDGGGSGDPQGNAQDLSSLLGKILRLDVDSREPYAIPLDNPFRTVAGARGEIWAYGLRNPWRFSFDREADRMYIADVGQNAWEEINVVPTSRAGVNYGWNLMEGRHCFDASSCDTSDLMQPVLEYANGDATCSVTGGYVYRGDAIPELRGHYFYGDFCAGWIRSFRVVGNGVTDEQEWSVGAIGNVLSFGEDAASELYVLTRGGEGGRVFKFVRVETQGAD